MDTPERIALGRRERRAAMRPWLARAGTGHADVNDVSSNKNRYLAEIYATKP